MMQRSSRSGEEEGLTGVRSNVYEVVCEKERVERDWYQAAGGKRVSCGRDAALMRRDGARKAGVLIDGVDRKDEQEEMDNSYTASGELS